MDTVGFIDGNNSKVVGEKWRLKEFSPWTTAVSADMNTDVRSITLIRAYREHKIMFSHTETILSTSNLFKLFTSTCIQH